jgi:hypothetical protein
MEEVEGKMKSTIQKNRWLFFGYDFHQEIAFKTIREEMRRLREAPQKQRGTSP